MDIKRHLQISNYPFGDCFRSCIASILKTEKVTDVPNFMQNGEEFFKENFREWLEENSFNYIEIEWNKPVSFHTDTTDQFCIISIKKKCDNVGHCVVGYMKYIEEQNTYQFDVIHDPLGRRIEDCVNDIQEVTYIGFLTQRPKLNYTAQ